MLESSNFFRDGCIRIRFAWEVWVSRAVKFTRDAFGCTNTSFDSRSNIE